jgi:hypothetical protein
MTGNTNMHLLVIDTLYIQHDVDVPLNEWIWLFQSHLKQVYKIEHTAMQSP